MMPSPSPVYWRSLRASARRHWLALAQGVLATLGVVALRLAIPWPLRGLIEVAFPGHWQRSTGWLDALPGWGEPLLWLCALYVLCAIGTGLVEVAQRLRMVQFASAVAGELTSQAWHGAVRRHRMVRSLTGDLLTRVVSDASRLRSDLAGVLVHLTLDGLLFLSIVGLFVFSISPQMGLFFLLGGVMAGWIGHRASAPLEEAALKAQDKEGANAATIQQMVEYGNLPAFKDADEELGDATAHGTRIVGVAALWAHSLLGLTVALAAYTGVRRVHAGQLAPGELFLFVAYALMVHRRLVLAGRQVARLGKIRAVLRRLAPLLAEAELERRTRPAWTLQQAVRLEAVNVAAVRGSHARVDGLTLELKAGARVAVLGRMGDGKSSLLRCLAGAEPVSSGRVLWDGKELDWHDEALHRAIGFLPQDPAFPSAPAWRVLGLSGAEELTRQQQEILQGAGIWDLVARFPKGLRQRISSASLSRNEARSLALGSVLLGDAPLWVLDSPVEGLGKRASAERITAILAHAGARTVLMALPHFYERDRFDRVLVLRRGRVRFDGTPEQWRQWRDQPEPELELQLERVREAGGKS